MLIQVNTGNGLENTEALQRWANEQLSATLDRFQHDITRVEVQLSDENSGKAGAADKRCMMEARLAHHQPVAVNHHGQTQDEAFRGAARKLLHALDHTLGKLRDHHRDRDSIRKDADGAPDTPA
ncbi:MAG: HPF/RaiA family ribosome-associated protein [Pseudomonadota bacterium]|nr:HPF/RaiA family ribosome-associated protein [Pseudomonadota bacterium]